VAVCVSPVVQSSSPVLWLFANELLAALHFCTIIQLISLLLQFCTLIQPISVLLQFFALLLRLYTDIYSVKYVCGPVQETILLHIICEKISYARA